MAEKTVACIICPLGCNIAVRDMGDSALRMEGNRCKRGEEYARDEFTRPMRILTTTVMLDGADSPLLPVRSDKPIPKELLMQCMAKIRNVCAKAPVARYDVLITNILGTDANIVATGEAKVR